MTVRSFASTIAANGSWIGFAVLFPLVVALLAAAALVEIGQLLIGLADLTCAACVDPSNGMPTGPFTAGTVGAGVGGVGGAAGGLGGFGSGSGGSGGGPTPPYSPPPPRPHWTDPGDDVGDTTPNVVPPRRPDSWYESPTMINASETVQKWAEDMLGGPEIKGTAPAGSKA